MKNIIINADDFGMNKTINHEIKDLIVNQKISSTTILVKVDEKTGSAEEIDKSTIDDALNFAKEYQEKISFGLHINLNKYFRFDELGLWSGKREQLDIWTKIFNENKEMILEDIREQFTIFGKYNLKISHIDGHNHIHMLPELLRELLIIMKEFNVSKIRFPKDLFSDKTLEEKLKGELRENQIIYPDNFIAGIPENEDAYLIDGVNEVMIHTFLYSTDGKREYIKLMEKQYFNAAKIISYNDFGVEI